jgi:AcrR family transcriptional regulator
MPYSPEHKQHTRQKILHSAYNLFALNGFDGVTVDDIMRHAELTRGGFYSHFKSKTELYKEAIKFGAKNSMLVTNPPNRSNMREWLTARFEQYLSIEHVRGLQPCPLAYLASDIVSRQPEIRAVYATVYARMNDIILDYLASLPTTPTRQNRETRQKVEAMTAMLIGAVAVARNMDDDDSINALLQSCRRQAKQMVDSFF